MSIAGFGAPLISRTPLAPAGRANALGRAAAPESSDFDSLTSSDRELIRHATGQRIEPGFDAHHTPTSMFAVQIAMSRAHGELGPGQDVTAGFLTDLSNRYDQGDPASNPIAPFLDKALAYLQARGGPRVDVNG